MPTPNEHALSFARGVSIGKNNNVCQLTQPLIDLLVAARQNYDWPARTGSMESQARIIALEANIGALMAVLNPAFAHQIVVSVSDWAGNNANSHARIVAATPVQQLAMQSAITLLTNAATASAGIDNLSALPGISLVIASKIYRFCVPSIGAAVDRHSSYFFNSLPVNDHVFSTNFRREWVNGKHTSSRLSIYQADTYKGNRAEYFAAYIPLLQCIAQQLNSGGHQFTCAATGAVRQWAPTDVEMAAYYWWAVHGAR